IELNQRQHPSTPHNAAAAFASQYLLRINLAKLLNLVHVDRVLPSTRAHDERRNHHQRGWYCDFKSRPLPCLRAYSDFTAQLVYLALPHTQPTSPPRQGGNMIGRKKALEKNQPQFFFVAERVLPKNEPGLRGARPPRVWLVPPPFVVYRDPRGASFKPRRYS